MPNITLYLPMGLLLIWWKGIKEMVAFVGYRMSKLRWYQYMSRCVKLLFSIMIMLLAMNALQTPTDVSWSEEIYKC